MDGRDERERKGEGEQGRDGERRVPTWTERNSAGTRGRDRLKEIRGSRGAVKGGAVERQMLAGAGLVNSSILMLGKA